MATEGTITNQEVFFQLCSCISSGSDYQANSGIILQQLAERDKKSIDDFLLSVKEVVLSEDYPPSSKFYSVYLLLKASETNNDFLMTRIGRHKSLLTHLFKTVQYDYKKPITERGLTYFSKTPSKEKSTVGHNYILLILESFQYWYSAYGTSDTNNSLYIYHTMFTSVSKQISFPETSYYVGKEYNLPDDFHLRLAETLPQTKDVQKIPNAGPEGLSSLLGENAKQSAGLDKGKNIATSSPLKSNINVNVGVKAGLGQEASPHLEGMSPESVKNPGEKGNLLESPEKDSQKAEEAYLQLCECVSSGKSYDAKHKAIIDATEKESTGYNQGLLDGITQLLDSHDISGTQKFYALLVLVRASERKNSTFMTQFAKNKQLLIKVAKDANFENEKPEQERGTTMFTDDVHSQDAVVGRNYMRLLLEGIQFWNKTYETTEKGSPFFRFKSMYAALEKLISFPKERTFVGKDLKAAATQNNKSLSKITLVDTASFAPKEQTKQMKKETSIAKKHVEACIGSGEDYQRNVKTVMNALKENSKEYNEDYLTTITNVLDSNDTPPRTKLYALWLLAKTTETKNKPLGEALAKHESLLEKVFQAAQHDYEKTFAAKGQHFFQGDPIVGNKYVNVSLEALKNWAEVYGTPKKNDPTHIYQFMYASLEDKLQFPTHNTYLSTPVDADVLKIFPEEDQKVLKGIGKIDPSAKAKIKDPALLNVIQGFEKIDEGKVSLREVLEGNPNENEDMKDYIDYIVLDINEHFQKGVQPQIETLLGSPDPENEKYVTQAFAEGETVEQLNVVNSKYKMNKIPYKEFRKSALDLVKKEEVENKPSTTSAGFEASEKILDPSKDNKPVSPLPHDTRSPNREPSYNTKDAFKSAVIEESLPKSRFGPNAGSKDQTIEAAGNIGLGPKIGSNTGPTIGSNLGGSMGPKVGGNQLIGVQQMISPEVSDMKDSRFMEESKSPQSAKFGSGIGAKDAVVGGSNSAGMGPKMGSNMGPSMGPKVGGNQLIGVQQMSSPVVSDIQDSRFIEESKSPAGEKFGSRLGAKDAVVGSNIIAGVGPKIGSNMGPSVGSNQGSGMGPKMGGTNPIGIQQMMISPEISEMKESRFLEESKSPLSEKALSSTLKDRNVVNPQSIGGKDSMGFSGMPGREKPQASSFAPKTGQDKVQEGGKGGLNNTDKIEKPMLSELTSKKQQKNDEQASWQGKNAYESNYQGNIDKKAIGGSIGLQGSVESEYIKATEPSITTVNKTKVSQAMGRDPAPTFKSSFDNRQINDDILIKETKSQTRDRSPQAWEQVPTSTSKMLENDSNMSFKPKPVSLTSKSYLMETRLKWLSHYRFKAGDLQEDKDDPKAQAQNSRAGDLLRDDESPPKRGTKEEREQKSPEPLFVERGAQKKESAKKAMNADVSAQGNPMLAQSMGPSGGRMLAKVGPSELQSGNNQMNIDLSSNSNTQSSKAMGQSMGPFGDGTPKRSATSDLTNIARGINNSRVKTRDLANIESSIRSSFVKSGKRAPEYQQNLQDLQEQEDLRTELLKLKQENSKLQKENSTLKVAVEERSQTESNTDPVSVEQLKALLANYESQVVSLREELSMTKEENLRLNEDLSVITEGGKPPRPSANLVGENKVLKHQLEILTKELSQIRNNDRSGFTSGLVPFSPERDVSNRVNTGDRIFSSTAGDKGFGNKFFSNTDLSYNNKDRAVSPDVLLLDDVMDIQSQGNSAYASTKQRVFRTEHTPDLRNKKVETEKRASNQPNSATPGRRSLFERVSYQKPQLLIEHDENISRTSLIRSPQRRDLSMNASAQKGEEASKKITIFGATAEAKDVNTSKGELSGGIRSFSPRFDPNFASNRQDAFARQDAGFGNSSPVNLLQGRASTSVPNFKLNPQEVNAGQRVTSENTGVSNVIRGRPSGLEQNYKSTGHEAYAEQALRLDSSGTSNQLKTKIPSLDINSRLAQQEVHVDKGIMLDKSNINKQAKEQFSILEQNFKPSQQEAYIEHEAMFDGSGMNSLVREKLSGGEHKLKAAPGFNEQRIEENDYDLKGMISSRKDDDPKEIRGTQVTYEGSMFSEITEKMERSAPSNDLLKFRMACLKNKCPIYDNDVIQIGVASAIVHDASGQRNLLKLVLYFGNRTNLPLTNFRTSIPNVHNVSRLINAEKLDDMIGPEKQTKRQVVVSFKATPFECLKMETDLEVENEKVAFSLYLPALITKFMEFKYVSAEEFREKWKSKTQAVLKTEEIDLDPVIVKSTYDFKKYFGYLVDLKPMDEYDFVQGKKSIKLGGIFELDVANVDYMIKINILPGHKVVFQVASNEDKTEVTTFLLQTLMFLFQKS